MRLGPKIASDTETGAAMKSRVVFHPRGSALFFQEQSEGSRCGAWSELLVAEAFASGELLLLRSSRAFEFLVYSTGP